MKIKLFLSILLVCCCFAISTPAFADNNAVIDMQTISANYKKMQSVTADLQVKEAELQKFVADAQVSLKSAKSKEEKKKLEDSLNKEFQTKKDGFIAFKEKNQQTLIQNVNNAISAVMKENKIDMVFHKQTVAMGGNDITSKVLQILNSSK